jgi:hypothetical protein
MASWFQISRELQMRRVCEIERDIPRAAERASHEAWNTAMTSHHTKHEIKEHDTQMAILDWLKLKHIFHWRNNTGGARFNHKGKLRFVKFGLKGSPDIYALIKGQIFGIEVKSPTGFQSQVQKEFEVEFTRAGGQYLLCFSLHELCFSLEDAIRGIERRRE